MNVKPAILPRSKGNSSVCRMATTRFEPERNRRRPLSASHLAPPGPGVGPIVDFCQMLKIKMGVDLGGFDIGVAKQFLYCPQVTAGFEQMGSEGMTQHVGMHPATKPLPLGPNL